MEPGIYFGLSEDKYHSDLALGSSSMKQVAVNPSDYWFSSGHNKVKLTKDGKEESDALKLGSAYHAMVLYGLAEFQRRYAIKRFSWATKEGKAEKELFESRSMTALAEDDWNRIMLAEKSIAANEELRNAFKQGPTEVSIFWEENGVSKKARIDCLKRKANTDLKTISPRDDHGDFERACMKQMGWYQYPVQAVHYNDGRAQIPRFISEGRVFGDHDRELLKKIAERQRWVSTFVFLKKTGAPLTWACQISFENMNVIDYARSVILQAEANYTKYKERFGLDSPWIEHKEIKEIAFEDMPRPF